MRAVWIDEGSDPDFPKLNPYAVERLYFAARDPRLSPAYLEEVRARGYTVGIYRATTWDVQLDPGNWAALLNADWSRLNGANRWLPVQANIEKEHGLDWVSSFLREWRRLRPGLDTSWGLEGFQGGWIAPIRQQVIDSHIRLAPETYGGTMDGPDEQQWDVWGTARDLILYGFPADRIDPFLDGKRVDPTKRSWDGFVFTQKRLA